MTPDASDDATRRPGSLEEALLELRQGIDATDNEILGLLNKRAALSLEVGRRKAGHDALRPPSEEHRAPREAR